MEFTAFASPVIAASHRATCKASSKLHIEAKVKGRPVSISGSLTLKPTTIGTEFVAEGKTSAKVIIIGRQVRNAIDDLVKESFEDETTVMLRWLDPNSVIAPA